MLSIQTIPPGVLHLCCVMVKRLKLHGDCLFCNWYDANDDDDDEHHHYHHPVWYSRLLPPCRHSSLPVVLVLVSCY